MKKVIFLICFKTYFVLSVLHTAIYVNEFILIFPPNRFATLFGNLAQFSFKYKKHFRNRLQMLTLINKNKSLFSSISCTVHPVINLEEVSRWKIIIFLQLTHFLKFVQLYKSMCSHKGKIKEEDTRNRQDYFFPFLMRYQIALA